MANDSTNVIQLAKHSASGKDSSHMLARLPAPFTQMREKGKQTIQPMLQALFDNIDDALFELADKAEANAEQNMYFESMREIRIKRRGMELGFGKGLDEAMVLLLQEPDNLPTLGEEDQVSVDSWALVKEEELEELVAIDSMAAKAERENSLELKQLSNRLDILSTSQSVNSKNNPFGPAVVCRVFVEVCKPLDLDIKAKLVLFKLFERYVMKDLGKVYKVCNEALIAGGIMPGMEGPETNASAATSGSQTQQSTGYGNDAPQGNYGEAGAVQPTSPQQDVFADLQQLLHRAVHRPAVSQPVQSAPTGGLVAPGQAPQIPRNTLMQLLQGVQHSLMADMDRQLQAALVGEVPRHLDVQQTLSNILSAQVPNKAMSIGQVDDDAINLVAMLFQFILDDRNLAAPMKALISRLQIPIIKVAMQDKSFFSKGGHPARKLLNEIANASLGWAPAENLDRDPLYKKVSDVVNRVLSEFSGDPDLFQEVLTDFVAFLEVDQRRIGMVEQRTITAEDGKAKSELARNMVQQALNEKVAGLTLPKVVITLLEEAWSNVLFLICLKEGEDSQNWHDALHVVDDLLFSVRPIEQPDQRRRLLTTIPGLLENLRKGLTKIGYNPFEMNQLFETLEAIHLEQLEVELPDTTKTADQRLAAKAQQQEQIAQQSEAIEQTLDQLLESRGNEEISLEQLDAELEKVLDGKLEQPTEATAKATAETGAETASVALAQETQPTVDNQLSQAMARETVDRLIVSGSSDEQHSVDDGEADLQASLEDVDALKAGCWVELNQDDGKKFRCRLAAVIRATSKYIFVNRSGMKVAEYTRNSLAKALHDGEVSTLDEGSLFDRALESVIGNLRDMKTSS